MKLKGWAVLHFDPHIGLWWTAGNWRKNSYDIRRNYKGTRCKVVKIIATVVARKKAK